MAAREDPDAAIHRGPEAIRAYFAQWTGMFEGIDFRAEELIEAGDEVFAWIRVSGTGVASGAAVEMEQARIWTFRNGKVLRGGGILRPRRGPRSGHSTTQMTDYATDRTG
jgi:ketosteroid isomerase-like protein